MSKHLPTSASGHFLLYNGNVFQVRITSLIFPSHGFIFPCFLESWSFCSQSPYTILESHPIPRFKRFAHLLSSYPQNSVAFIHLSYLSFSTCFVYRTRRYPFLVIWLRGYRTFFISSFCRTLYVHCT